MPAPLQALLMPLYCVYERRKFLNSDGKRPDGQGVRSSAAVERPIHLEVQSHVSERRKRAPHRHRPPPSEAPEARTTQLTHRSARPTSAAESRIDERAQSRSIRRAGQRRQYLLCRGLKTHPPERQLCPPRSRAPSRLYTAFMNVESF